LYAGIPITTSLVSRRPVGLEAVVLMAVGIATDGTAVVKLTP